MIQLNFHDPQPIYEQVRRELCRLIANGVLPPGSRMPSVRELAASLAINPNTIQRAYRELEQAGYICTVPGKGSFVCAREDAATAHRRELLDRLAVLAGELRQCGATEEELMNVIKGGKTSD